MYVRPMTLIKAWWTKYRRWIIVLLVVYLVGVLVLILLTLAAEGEPFQYQIF